MIKYFYGPVKAGKTEKVIKEVISSNSNFAYIKVNKSEDILKQVPVRFNSVIIGNAHFLDDEQILLLRNWSKENYTDIYFIGLIKDGRNREYPSHNSLLYLSDKSIEIEKLCECGQKATHNICVSVDGEALLHGDSINTKGFFKAVCLDCYNDLIANAKHKEDAILAQETLLECYN